MIKIEKLTKKYDEIAIIDNESFEIPENGITVVKGESGIGKTTLFNCILEYDESFKGMISIDDHISKRAKRKFRNNNIGIVSQNNNLVENETILYNLELALKLANKKIDDEKIKYCLEMVGLKNYQKRMVESLSGGQKQRVAIARALVIGPKYLFLDEPTSNLDYDNSVKIFNLLKSISKDVSIVVISHDEKISSIYADYFLTFKNEGIYFSVNNLNTYNIKIEKKDEVEKISFENGMINVIKPFNGNIKLYLYNDKIYIDSDLEIIKGTPRIEKKYEDIDETEFNLDKFDNDKKVRFSKLYINISLFIALALFLALSTFMMSLYGDKSFCDFQLSNENVYVVNCETKDLKTIYDKLTKQKDVYVFPYEYSSNFEMVGNNLMQTKNSVGRSITFECTPLPYSNEKTIFGSTPSNKYEGVLDKLLIDKIKRINESAYLFGNNDYKSFVGTRIKLYEDFYIKITGIVDTNTPTIYMNDYSISEAYLANKLSKFKFICNEETEFENKNDIYLCTKDFEKYNTLGVSNITVDGYIFNIAGSLEKIKEDMYLISTEMMDTIVYDNIISEQHNIRCYANDENDILSKIGNVNIYKPVNVEYDNFKDKTNSSRIVCNVISGLLIIVGILFLYFSLKSYVLERENYILVSKLLGNKSFIKELFILGLTFVVFVIPISILIILMLFKMNDIINLNNISFEINFSIIFKSIAILLIQLIITLSLLYKKYIRRKEIDIINELK